MRLLIPNLKRFAFLAGLLGALAFQGTQAMAASNSVAFCPLNPPDELGDGLCFKPRDCEKACSIYWGHPDNFQAMCDGSGCCVCFAT